MPPEHNALADMFHPGPLCCGGGSHDGHAAWCGWGRAPVGPELHDGRQDRGRACGYCRAPAGVGCVVSPAAEAT